MACLISMLFVVMSVFMLIVGIMLLFVMFFFALKFCAGLDNATFCGRRHNEQVKRSGKCRHSGIYGRTIFGTFRRILKANNIRPGGIVLATRLRFLPLFCRQFTQQLLR